MHRYDMASERSRPSSASIPTTGEAAVRNSKNKRVAQISLAGVALAAVLAVPVGSAASLSAASFAIKATNIEKPGTYAIKPLLKGGTGSVTPTAPPTTAVPTTPPTQQPNPEPTRAPDSAPTLISMKIDTSLPGCTAATSGTGFNFTVPTYSTTDAARTPLTANASINWGDGSADSTAKTGANSHVYKAGKYELKINGKLGGITDSAGASSSCISEVTHLGEDTGLVTLEAFLNSAVNVTYVSAPPTSLQNANRMLAGATSFVGSGVDTWVLPNLKTASSMFNSASKFDGDLSNLNAKKLTDASNMFRNGYAFTGKGLDKWKTTSFTNIKGIFESNDKFQGDVSKWDVSAVTDFSRSFYGVKTFTGDLSSWSTGSGTSFDSMFNTATLFNSDISNWNMAKATTFASMFSNAKSFNQPIGKWTTTNLTSLSQTFANASAFSQDLTHWNVSKVTDLTNTFFTSGFNGDVSNWDTTNVTTMSGTFYKTPFSGSLKNWNLTNTTATAAMFQYTTNFNSDISSWNVSKVTNMANMFWGAASFNQPLSAWSTKTGNVTVMNYMFFQSGSFSQNISTWNVSKVTVYDYFAGNSKLTKAQVPAKFQSTVS